VLRYMRHASCDEQVSHLAHTHILVIILDLGYAAETVWTYQDAQ